MRGMSQIDRIMGWLGKKEEILSPCLNAEGRKEGRKISLYSRVSASSVTFLSPSPSKNSSNLAGWLSSDVGFASRLPAEFKEFIVLVME